MKTRTREIVAVHEAGHIVTAFVLKKRVISATIKPTSTMAGNVEFDWGLIEDLTAFKKVATCMLGGIVAESMLTGVPAEEIFKTSPDSDIESIAAAAKKFMKVEEFESFIRECHEAARIILKFHYPQVLKFANLLLKKETLNFV